MAWDNGWTGGGHGVWELSAWKFEHVVPRMKKLRTFKDIHILYYDPVLNHHVLTSYQCSITELTSVNKAHRTKRRVTRILRCLLPIYMLLIYEESLYDTYPVHNMHTCKDAAADKS